MSETTGDLARQRAMFAHLLRWYADMGVDIAIDPQPHDRFAETQAALALTRPVIERAEAPAADERSATAPEPLPPIPSAPDAPLVDRSESAYAAAQSARELAAKAATLDELRTFLARFEGCNLRASAIQLVFADGNPQARLMLIGEAPGAEEDRQGLPFVGRAGQLLNRMLAAIGLTRADVYIANAVPWRPPGNRTPTPQEAAICLPFILRQIALVNPDLVVCLGGSAAQTLLGLKGGITRTRGHWRELTIGGGDRPIRVVRALATLHPAYLLRQPALKRLAWRDFREIKRALTRLPERPARSN
jgi:DNA polymerase